MYDAKQNLKLFRINEKPFIKSLHYAKQHPFFFNFTMIHSAFNTSGSFFLTLTCKCNKPYSKFLYFTYFYHCVVYIYIYILLYHRGLFNALISSHLCNSFCYFCSSCSLHLVILICLFHYALKMNLSKITHRKTDCVFECNAIDQAPPH